jgi:predicted ABC-class ATPase
MTETDGGGAMRMVLRALARPWCVVRRVRALKDTIVALLRQLLDHQRAVSAEIRELHQSSLLAAIHVIEEQRQAREALAQDYARLERRLASLERQLAAVGNPVPDHTAGG